MTTQPVSSLDSNRGGSSRLAQRALAACHPYRVLRTLQSTWEWLKDLGEVLKPCRFSVLVMVLLFVAFVLVPQGQDLLRRMAEWKDRPWTDLFRVLGLSLLALLCLAAGSWYFSRVMLYFRFGDHKSDDPRLENLRTWLPRVLGTAPFAILFLAFARAAISYKNPLDLGPRFRLWVMVLVCFLAGVKFFLTVKNRRDRSFARHWRSAPQTSYGKLGEVLPGTARALVASMVVSIALFLAFAIIPVKLGACFGAAGIVLIATATWIPLGSALVYFGHRVRLPIMTMLALLALGSSFVNDNHVVRTFPKQKPPQILADLIDPHLRQWLDNLRQAEPEAGTYPIIVVSTEGGGARAAYWTANVLTQIQEDAPSFARHVYAISGVSGGSLGAATFAALLRTAGPKEALACNRPEQGQALRTLRGCAQAVLSHDFLSPTLARMLHSDLAQRFIPYPFPRWDRSRALEGSWEAAWRHTLKGSNQFAEPFADLWKGESPVPNLVLNGTWVETGKRIVTTNLRFAKSPFNDSQDFFNWAQSDVPLSTAVHNSARFAYISPAGLIKSPDDKARAHVVDGGYFENSGGTSAYEIFSRVVVLKEKLEEENAPFRVLPILITISNTPWDGDEDEEDAFVGLLDARAPLVTMYQTRTARATYAIETLKKYAESENQETCRRQGRGNCKEILFFSFGTCKEDRRGHRFTAPLGWQLSGIAMSQMDYQLDNNCRRFDNPGSLRKIKELLSPAAPQPTHPAPRGAADRSPAPGTSTPTN